jgi:C-terminal processing protease CtpA/Prc
MKTCIILTVVILLIAGCKEPPPPSPEALSYLDEALDIMKQKSLRRDSVDWKTLRTKTVTRLQGARDPRDTYEEIRYALASLGDFHSFLATPEQAESWKKERRNSVTETQVHSELLFSRFAWISVPAFSSGNDTAMRSFAGRIQHVIAALDSADVCGWIIDLRKNVGGNMWPMIAGLGPILGEGELGSFVGAFGIRTSWWYKQGSAGLDTAALVAIAGPPYVVRRPNLPVAVLTGRNTASSGEAVLVAFRGRPATRSFGAGTRGLSTANEPFALSDGAMLVLTTAVFADRTGKAYGTVIDPDEHIQTGEQYGPSSDPVVQAAVAWLKSQNPCVDN